MIHLSPEEQETIINFNEGENLASVYTHNRALLSKLQRLSEQHPEACKLQSTCHGGRAAEYLLPKKWVKISPPRKSKPLSEERKKALAEQLQRARATQNQ